MRPKPKPRPKQKWNKTKIPKNKQKSLYIDKRVDLFTLELQLSCLWVRLPEGHYVLWWGHVSLNFQVLWSLTGTALVFGSWLLESIRSISPARDSEAFSGLLRICHLDVSCSLCGKFLGQRAFSPSCIALLLHSCVGWRRELAISPWLLDRAGFLGVINCRHCQELEQTAGAQVCGGCGVRVRCAVLGCGVGVSTGKASAEAGGRIHPASTQ